MITKQNGRTVVLHKDDEGHQVWYHDTERDRVLPDGIIFEVDWPVEEMVFWHKADLYVPPAPKLK